MVIWFGLTGIGGVQSPAPVEDVGRHNGEEQPQTSSSSRDAE